MFHEVWFNMASTDLLAANITDNRLRNIPVLQLQLIFNPVQFSICDSKLYWYFGSHPDVWRKLRGLRTKDKTSSLNLQYKNKQFLDWIWPVIRSRKVSLAVHRGFILLTWRHLYEHVILSYLPIILFTGIMTRGLGDCAIPAFKSFHLIELWIRFRPVTKLFAY